MKLVEDMRGRQCVMWVANFYKMRFGVNPGAADHSVNATAMAVMLNVRLLGTVEKYPMLTELLTRMRVLFMDIVHADSPLSNFVRSSFGGVTEDAIRVPLDVVRKNANGQKWRPHKLTNTVLGSMEGLLDMLDEVRAPPIS